MLQILHRIRSQLVSSRARLISQMRAFCLEFGVALRQGAGVFKFDLPAALVNEHNDLTGTMRRLLSDMLQDLMSLEKRIKALSDEIEALADKDETAQIDDHSRHWTSRCDSYAGIYWKRTALSQR